MTPPQPTTGPEMFGFLREQLFSGNLAEMTAPGSTPASATPDDVLGVAMEMGIPKGTALVLGLRDGTASLYFSGGGGSIGGQGRPNINAAAKRLVETAKGLLLKLAPTTEHPLPAAGRIRFSVFTPTGVRAAELAEAELLSGASALTPLFRGAHQIITGFRLADEHRKPNEPLYINLLLTALARGTAASVVLTADAPLPDPATLTNDGRDLEWLASIGLAIEAQSAEKVIQRLLEAAGFRRFHLRKTEGQLRTTLEGHDGGAAIDFDFRVTKRTEAGRLQIEITPLRDQT